MKTTFRSVVRCSSTSQLEKKDYFTASLSISHIGGPPYGRSTVSTTLNPFLKYSFFDPSLLASR